MICPGCGLPAGIEKPCSVCGYLSDKTLMLSETPSLLSRIHRRYRLLGQEPYDRDHEILTVFDTRIYRLCRIVRCHIAHGRLPCYRCRERESGYALTIPSLCPAYYDRVDTPDYIDYVYEYPSGLPFHRLAEKIPVSCLIVLLLKMADQFKSLHARGFIFPAMTLNAWVLTGDHRLRALHPLHLRRYRYDSDTTRYFSSNHAIPDDITGQYGPWSDTYALSRMLLPLIPRFLCRRNQNLNVRVKPLVDFLNKALHRDPVKRFQTMDEWKDGLRSVFPDLGIKK